MARTDRNNPRTLESVREQLRTLVAETTQADSPHDYGYFKEWVGALATCEALKSEAHAAFELALSQTGAGAAPSFTRTH
ncbi:hypothetical protein [Pseudomonas sp. 460]|uniref:hypothetical protein n=1 Tax=Pseudomonas sp. 460 TaxID=2485142 RepID=UPI00104D5BB2|nr:hypothetical protein [Pseudomonas sp. 460]TCV51458.1 hypothetical protein EDB99_107124 [Pseudomonas sp. 460]